MEGEVACLFCQVGWEFGVVWRGHCLAGEQAAQHMHSGQLACVHPGRRRRAGVPCHRHHQAAHLHVVVHMYAVHMLTK